VAFILIPTLNTPGRAGSPAKRGMRGSKDHG
jgi:hypothetical protein